MNARQRGFTLIELVAIIVLLSIAGTAILGMFGQVGRSLTTNQDTQTGAQLVQEKAEQILADRRNAARGFAWIVAANYPAETPISGFAAFDRSVTISDITTSPPCPVTTAGTCRQVVVRVSMGLVTVAQNTFMVVNY
jgi:prepilin-type N-terminal cleavage/methylation domain-containing protein